jgi:hypothetical protein
MVIVFARAKSDAIAKADGTYAPRSKRARPTPPTGGAKNKNSPTYTDLIQLNYTLL